MKIPHLSFYALLCGLLLLTIGNVIASAFFIKWPWSYYPGLTGGINTPTTATIGGTLNYGFLRPAVIVQVPTTLAPATTTTTTTTTTRPPTTTLSPTQILINALLASSLPVNNNSLLLLANALANRPVIGGIAQPFPQVVGGGTVGGVAGFPGFQSPAVGGGINFPSSAAGIAGGIAGPAGGQLLLPNGFPASGGVLSSGVLPGLFPGIIGKSAHAVAKASGRIVFGSKRK